MKIFISTIVAVFLLGLTTIAHAETFGTNLTIGSTGPEVIELQTWLEGNGYLVIPSGISKGYFGQLTVSALAKYQTSQNITPAVGYFGPITRAKLNHVLLSKNGDRCDSIKNSKFRGLKKTEMGLGPDGAVFGYPMVTFKDGKFYWALSDIGGSGSYSCKDNSVVLEINVGSIGSTYNPETKILKFYGVEYQIESASL